MTRFEIYVRETLADRVKTRRDELAAAVESAKAELDAKMEVFNGIVDAVCAEADKKIRALAAKWGWKAESDCRIVDAPPSLDRQLGDVFRQLRRTFGTRNGKTGYWYDAAHPITIAQQALDEFDDAVEKAARRLVVVKKDLGMKPEAFDKAMADAIAKLLK